LRSNSIFVDLHGVVDDEVDGHERVDLLGIAAGAFHGGAHGGEVDDGGNAGEILQHHPRDLERHFDRVGFFRVPRGQAVDVFLGDFEVVGVAQAAFQEHLDGKRQLVDVPDAGLDELVEPEIPEVAAFRGNCCFCAERIEGLLCHGGKRIVCAGGEGSRRQRDEG
jgi:hypothetical protein